MDLKERNISNAFQERVKFQRWLERDLHGLPGCWSLLCVTFSLKALKDLSRPRTNGSQSTQLTYEQGKSGTAAGRNLRKGLRLVKISQKCERCKLLCGSEAQPDLAQLRGFVPWTLVLVRARALGGRHNRDTKLNRPDSAETPEPNMQMRGEITAPEHSRKGKMVIGSRKHVGAT